MAKKATAAGGKGAAKKSSTTKGKAAPRKAVRVSSSSRKAEASDFNAVDALLKLLQSPLVADLLAVGATAAIAAITEGRHSRKSGNAAAKTLVKAAGVAAAAAIGRRLADEYQEIREVSKKSRANAKG